MRGLRLVLLGPPGSGKGTQARMLSDRFGWAALSSGDVLRAEVAHGSAIGKAAAEFMQRGALVPDEVISGVMLATIDRLPPGSGIVMDGFPRTVPQAAAVEKGLVERHMAIDAIIDFTLSDAEVIRRIADRRVCSRCARTYNLSFVPPITAGHCDSCGGELIQRADDRNEVVAARLETYRRQTAPLEQHYRHDRRMQTIDAALPADEVERRVLAILERVDRGQ